MLPKASFNRAYELNKLDNILIYFCGVPVHCLANNLTYLEIC